MVFDAQDQHGNVHRVLDRLDGDAPTAGQDPKHGPPYRYIIQTSMNEKLLRFVEPRRYETLDGAIVITSDFFE